MAGLRSNEWSQWFKDSLDRYITGNWGEDAFLGDIDDTTPLEPEPSMRLVYIVEAVDHVWSIFDARTSEFLADERSRHDAVEYCTSEGWDVRDGPVASDDVSDEGLDQGFYAEEAYFERETEDNA